MDGQGFRAQVLAALADAGIGTQAVTGAVPPEAAGLVAIEWDTPDLAGAVIRVLAAVSPRLVLVPERAEPGGYGLHAVGGTPPWVEILISDPDFVPDDEEDQGPALQDELATAEHVRELLAAAASSLLEAPTPPPHPRASAVRDALIDAVRAAGGESDVELVQRRYEIVWEITEQLRQDLRLKHQRDFRLQADDLAAQMLAAEPTLRGARIGVLRDAAYDFLKRIDPACATRASSEPVATAAGTIVSASKSTLDR